MPFKLMTSTWCLSISLITELMILCCMLFKLMTSTRCLSISLITGLHTDRLEHWCEKQCRTRCVISKPHCVPLAHHLAAFRLQASYPPCDPLYMPRSSMCLLSMRMSAQSADVMEASPAVQACRTCMACRSTSLACPLCQGRALMHKAAASVLKWTHHRARRLQLRKSLLCRKAGWR